MSDLDDLLSRLHGAPTRAVSYQGRAVGRDEDHLHLAVATGVIAIPLTAIEHLRAIGGLGTDDVVSVEVSDPAGVRQLRRVVPLPAGMPVREQDRFLARGGSGGLVVRDPGYTYEVSSSDTATVTAGNLDATDDAVVVWYIGDTLS
jgi:hypothetical protein